MAKDNLGKKIAAGALFAGAVGYVAGVLTAPKSGKETRKDIKDTASKAKREAEKQLKTLHSELDVLLGKAKVVSEKVGDKASQELKDLTVSATAAKEKARQVLSAIHEGDADDPDLAEAVKSATNATHALKKFLNKHV